MTELELRQSQMLVRVREFGAAHRDLFPARSVAGKLFAAVAAAADALERHETTELAGRGGEQEGAASKAAARAALRRQVRAIVYTARASEVPGLGGTFRGPAADTDERLLAQARTFLREAKPFAGTFVAHELPPKFLSRLRDAIEAFERATAERRSGHAQRVGARASIEATMEAGLRAARRLGAIVPNKVQDPSVVALWNGARRIEPARAKNGATVAPEPSPSASAVTPAA